MKKMKTRKTFISFLLGIVMSLALIFGVVFALPQSQPTKAVEAAGTYTTKDVAMLGSVAGWHGNGNFEIQLTLGECDWASESGQKNFDTTLGLGDLPTLLRNLDLFNHIQLGDKTLAEWGCTSCYGNIYWLNEGEPKYTVRIPLAMGADNMAAATAAGIGANSRITIKEGALIPSYGYLTGTSDLVYRAGCDFVTQSSDVAYGVMAYAKTEVESLQYTTGWDSNLNNAYLGVSLKGDDFLGDGTQTERHQDYYSSVYTTNHYSNKITVDGEGGKAESYGLFNLGSKGQGYYSFVWRAKAEESESITIPAGTLFPSFAMRTLFDAYGNPVYIMYETQTDVTFYNQGNGTWLKYIESDLTDVKVVSDAGNANDQFLLFTPANNDYAQAPNTYNGTAIKAADFIKQTNFYSHVLVDDQPIAESGEVFLNVWSNFGTFALRPGNTSATKITVLAGCQIPTYNALKNGVGEVYVTTQDVTFVKNTSGEWVRYVPEGDFDTAVTQVQFGRSTNVLNINLSVSDYPAPDGNNAATYNMVIDPEKILSLNLFDNIIVDGYTLRTRYNNYKDMIGSDPWLWINKFVGHNFAVCVPSADGTDIGADKIVIRAGTQFPSMAYINSGAQAFYVTTEEVTYVRVSDNPEISWAKQAKITFKADGETVATLPYTVAGGIDGEVPEVPYKEFNKGVWESYTLNGNDIVVNAVYTPHTFTEIETNISKLQYEAGFLIVHLTHHDYPDGVTADTQDVKAIVSNLHFFDYIEIDGKMASSAPAVGGEAYINIWQRTGSVSSRLPDGTSAPANKVVIKKGAQFPSNAYRLDNSNKTCYVLTEDVTFLYENGAWVRQGSGEGGNESLSIMPEYENNYVLSDLYQVGYPASTELKDGQLFINSGSEEEKTQGNVFGYNTSHSFSLTFDFTLDVDDVSALGDYTSFDISMSTRGYNWSDALGWTFYIYRPENPNKCVEFHCTPSTHAGAFFWWEEAGTFEAGVTYRVTIGYKLLDASNGTVQTYLNINGSEDIREFILGQPYVDFMYNIDAIAFNTNTAVKNAVRLSDPGLAKNETTHTVTLQNGDKTIVSDIATSYTLPDLSAYEYGNAGEVFVGWTTDKENLSNLYPAGYEMEVTADTTLHAVWIYMSMQNGAAVRKTGQSGLRFLVDIDGAAYQLGVEKNFIVGTGTLVVPSNYLTSNVKFVHETFPEGYFLDIPTETWGTQTGAKWTYAAALVNISPAQYTRAMSARGYLKVAYTDGTQSYIYTAYSPELHSRSIYSVATAAVKDNVTTEAVLNYVNSVADITISSGFDISKNVNSVGNYTVSASQEGMTFSITFVGNIKSVIINGTRILAGYTADVTIGGMVYTVEGFKLTSNGATLTFTLGEGDKTAYYEAIIEYYKNSNDYSPLHKEKILAMLAEWDYDFSDDETNELWVLDLEGIKTQVEEEKNVGDVKLDTPVVTYGLGYAVTWEAIENADYYLVTDDNDYRDGVIVVSEGEESFTYKPEVVGKHNVTVTAYSYYQAYACSNASASFATVEVKPVYSYKAMNDGLYKFTEDSMKTLGLGDGLNTNRDGTSYDYDPEEELYFAYYNKTTGWSKNEGNATDWTSPDEFPAHAAKLKAMGNNIILLAENTNASFGENDVWETSRTKYIMDTAWTLGMKVLVCDDVLYQKSSVVTSKSAAASIIADRDGFADYVTHPAFYGFSLEDEPEPNSTFTGHELESVCYMIQALKDACAELGLSKVNGNEPFFLSCLYQYSSGFEDYDWYVSYEGYLEDWFDSGLDYVYVDLYTGHAMGDNTNRYKMTYDVVYGNGTNGVLGSDKKFYQVITAHTQSKDKTGYLTEQDLYMSMLYAAAHNVAGYSWFCYFPINDGYTEGSMVGFKGNGYGNGIGNGAEMVDGKGKSYYNAAATAGYQFELIQGVLNGYSLDSRSYNDSTKLLTTTLTKSGASEITIYVNADTQSVSANCSVTASGSVCYLVGYGVGTADAPYQVVPSGSITLAPGQAVICVG